MSYHKTSQSAPRWQETHNASQRNSAGTYRRSMTGPILPMPKRKWWQL